MVFQQSTFRLYHIILLLCFLIFSFFGCTILGPRAISMGRADYNEAISRTDDQQMLMAIVHHRYGETIKLLAVTSVTANVRFAANAGAEFGFGPDDNYAGSLVPFSAGAVYEENPTISYAPIESVQYLRQIMSPMPLDILLLIIRSTTWPRVPFTLLVSRINDIRNPNFLKLPMVEPDPRFIQFADLITELNDAGCVHLVKDPRKTIEHAVLIRNYDPTYIEQVKELMSLLKLTLPIDKYKDIIIPIYFAVKDKDVFGISIETRSLFDLITIAAASVEVPERHANSGLAQTYPPTGLAGRQIHIHHSEEKPKNASVAVKYRGFWFYISGMDQSSKNIFRLISTLWSVRIGEEAKVKTAPPILTVPVKR